MSPPNRRMGAGGLSAGIPWGLSRDLGRRGSGTAASRRCEDRQRAARLRGQVGIRVLRPTLEAGRGRLRAELAQGRAGHLADGCGLVLEGGLTIDFNGSIVSFAKGDGLFIPAGVASAHRAVAITPGTRLLMVEDAEQKR